MSLKGHAMTAKTRCDKPSDGAARKPQKSKGRDELEAAELDKVTGGMSKIVKSADPCEGGR
jgi:hypothetical protein